MLGTTSRLTLASSDALRDEFLSYCARETKLLSSNSVEALSRIQPRSDLLLEHCLRTLDGRRHRITRIPTRS